MRPLVPKLCLGTARHEALLREAELQDPRSQAELGNEELLIAQDIPCVTIIEAREDFWPPSASIYQISRFRRAGGRAFDGSSQSAGRFAIAFVGRSQKNARRPRLLR